MSIQSLHATNSTTAAGTCDLQTWVDRALRRVMLGTVPKAHYFNTSSKGLLDPPCSARVHRRCDNLR